MNDWRRFRNLPVEERSIFLGALALLPVVRLGLKTMGWRRVQAALGMGRRNLPDQAKDDQTRIAQGRRAARLVAAAARLAGGTCLARSLVLVHILDRRGIPAELRIGVRSGEEGFEAHSWVEIACSALNEGSDPGQRYAAFDRNFALARINWR